METLWTVLTWFNPGMVAAGAVGVVAGYKYPAAVAKIRALFTKKPVDAQTVVAIQEVVKAELAKLNPPKT